MLNSTPIPPVRLPPELKRISSTGELAGPCPHCGGRDRLHLIPDNRRAGGYVFFCRQCHPRPDDMIALHQWLYGSSFQEAAKEVAPDRMQTHGVAWQERKTFFPVRQKEIGSVLPVSMDMPSAGWRTQAAALLRKCQLGFDVDWDMRSCPSEQALFHIMVNRQLSPHTCLVTGIGFHEHEEYHNRADWQLPAKATGRGKLRIPRGIVIAIRRKKLGIVALLIRRLDEDLRDVEPCKYWQVAGGSKSLCYGIGRPGLPVVICESCLDAALVWQESGGKVAAIATMGATKQLDKSSLYLCRQAPLVILAYDTDTAGRAAIAILRRQVPDAVPVAPVGAKDIGDMQKLVWNLEAELDVKTWLGLALRYAGKVN